MVGIETWVTRHLPRRFRRYGSSVDRSHNLDLQPSARVLHAPSIEAFGQESSSPRTVSKVACLCVLFTSDLCFICRVVAFKEAQPEPTCVEASTSRTTESPQRVCAGSSFPSSGWRKHVAGYLLSVTFTMQTMLNYFLDTIAGDGRSSSNFKAIPATDKQCNAFYFSKDSSRRLRWMPATILYTIRLTVNQR